ncbi:hypothetical protein LRAMOSA01305 [Lichtheimia ramosa]|uniref:Uncharacterized protein n=1 Tax=Lichtheimia ramosa TaxID=688394 RepID=A0A077WHW6_9FUNG|nr:hypothetical protein LRAMOSA01305 [Lichtheimia ramosa]
MSVQHPTCFLQDDLYTTRQMATATNCRKVSLIRTNLYPDSASTLVEDAHISHTNATSTTGTTTTTSSSNNFFQPAFFMLLFSRLIDAVIFTSAIAITAYNYWTGDLPQPAATHQALISSAPAPSRTSSSSRSKRNSYTSSTSPLVKVRRRMTEEWAADTLQDNEQDQHQQHNRASTYARPTFASMNKFHSSPAVVSGDQQHNKSQHVRTKHRSKSFNQPKQSQDEMLARMQTQLENLIQEGQAALNSPAFDMEDDEDGRDNSPISPCTSRRSRRINQKKHHKRYSSVFP